MTGTVGLAPMGRGRPKNAEGTRQVKLFADLADMISWIVELANDPKVTAASIVALLAACGCRLGEAAALDTGDFDGTRISITKTYRPPHGTGPPKSHRSRRTITVPAAARPVLAALVAGRPPTAALFRRPRGGRYTAATVQAAFRRHCARLGLPVKKLHALRHSVISALVGAGWPLADVARYTGDSVGQVVKTYVHPANKDPAGCLDELFA